MPDRGAVIMECEYFPCWEWFSAFMHAEEVLLEQYENFVRASYRNRTYVAGPNGVIALSVPLQGGRNQRTILKEVKVCNKEKWQSLHWKSLESFYRNSAYFEYYQDTIRAFFQKEFTYLLDVNLASLELILQLLQLKKEYKLTTAYDPQPQRKDLRSQFRPKDRKLIKQEPYVQPFSDRNGFESNLGMLDFLFCCGKWT